MKKSLWQVFVVIVMVVLPALATASEAPVILTHQLTSSTEGSSTVTHNYLIHLENPADSPISNLNLFLVPRPPFLTGEVALTLPYLAPHQSADFEVSLAVPATPRGRPTPNVPLFFTGTRSDADGNQVSFPVTSQPRLPGGVR